MSLLIEMQIFGLIDAAAILVVRGTSSKLQSLQGAIPSWPIEQFNDPWVNAL